MKKISVKQKLYYGFGGICAVLILCGVVGVYQINILSNQSDKLTVNRISTFSLIKEIKFLSAKGHLCLEELLAMDETESLEQVMNMLNTAIYYCDLVVSGGSAGTTVVEATDNEVVRDYIVDAQKKLKELVQLSRQLVKIAQAGELFAGSEAYIQFDSQFKKLIEDLQNAEAETAAEILATQKSMISQFQTGRISLIVLSLVGLGLMFFFITLLTKTVINPVNELAETALKIANGDTSLRVQVHADDEIGQMAQSFNLMADHLEKLMNDLQEEKCRIEQKVVEAVTEVETQRRYLKQNVNELLESIEALAQGDLRVNLRETAEGDIAHLYTGFNRAISRIEEMLQEVQQAVHKSMVVATKLSHSAEELSASMQTQSHQAAEVAAAVEEMTRTIQHTSQNTSYVAEQVALSGQSAREGGKIVRQTIKKINQIADTVLVSTQTVETLGNASSKIGEIVMVIDDIADQTNLLALNAAIEAARAGEHGHGFAVVADEVRRLAERTTKATKKISEMINEIQNRTQNVVDAMKKGSQEVISGIELADQAGKALDNIVEGTDRLVAMVQQIAAANQQQYTTSEEISRKVESISGVVSESEQDVDMVARVAEEVNLLTRHLQVLMSRFQTKVSAEVVEG
jgi:methyl-accepting chemotaxis protein